MKVLVTGHKGYIGVHLVALLKEAGHHVTGVDLGLFDGCAWDETVPADVELRKDIRKLTPEEVAGHDCIMHLAAISNDAMGELNPQVTYAINRDGSIRLAQLAKDVGVPRFLFSSSCSIYGQGASLHLDEDAPFNPITAYAESKIATEQALRELADDHFCPVYLRNATAYGYSPMFRLDLVVNNLLSCAFSRGDIRVMSDGSPWRPLVHCKDIARAFIACMEAPREAVHNLAINVGANGENYQVKDVADLVQKFIPQADVVFTGEVGADPRNYCVNFDRLNRALPGFTLSYTLETGMAELHGHLTDYGFSQDDFTGSKFVRLRTLKARQDLDSLMNLTPLPTEPVNAL